MLAELADKSVIPTPGQIQLHPLALVSYEFHLKKVLKGHVDHEWVLVAQWALLDGQQQPIVTHTLGTEATLLLEAFDGNPQAQRYLYSDDLTLDDGGERFLEI